MLEPLGAYLLVEVPEKKETTEAGIVLPGTADLDRPQTGKVTAKGPKADTVEVGDTVVYRQYAPDKVRVENVEYTLVDLADVIARIR